MVYGCAVSTVHRRSNLSVQSRPAMSSTWLAQRLVWAITHRQFRYYYNPPLIDTTNQHFSSGNDQQLAALFRQFDTDKIRFAFGYGSGVFQQEGYGDSRPQIDVVHVVDQATTFHAANSATHPNHYSALLQLGVPTVAAVQNYGAGVYFNPYVSMRDNDSHECMVKYGVVTTDTALEDIREWSTLYIAGRLQKPVKHLHGDEKLQQANDQNLENAFKVALLLLLSKSGRSIVNASQIYEKIALLSYMGDPRMAVGGENPNKVKNIVSKQADKFAQLYRPYLERAMLRGDLASCGDGYDLRMKHQSIASAIATLPLHFRRQFLSGYTLKYAKEFKTDELAQRMIRGDAEVMTAGPFLNRILTDKWLKRQLASTLLSTIAYPALIQSLKGVFTAGAMKSARYAWEKKRKSWSV